MTSNLTRGEWITVADSRLEYAARKFRHLQELFYPPGRTPREPSHSKAVGHADEVISDLRAMIDALESMKECQQ